MKPGSVIFICPGHDAKLHMMVRLQSWSLWEFGVPLHCTYSQVHSDPEWSYLLESY